ncbi:hypothetical protein OOJ09_12705 [Mesorhizobium qingshengii]|uniref:Uncharacterized protein n=1 Tax=Mesorhizobium qingshengii TaxID=1165689 RepID=A0ABT4QTY1_9HYPH|nr:hypothetical protein [Mesorhizobium qingshengii]MCZ8545046.1 hypothetical protein [Mesorhizobium qingshengii]
MSAEASARFALECAIKRRHYGRMIVSLILGLARAQWQWLLLIIPAAVAVEYMRISAASAWCHEARAAHCLSFDVETVLWTVAFNAAAYGVGRVARFAFDRARKTA